MISARLVRDWIPGNQQPAMAINGLPCSMIALEDGKKTLNTNCAAQRFLRRDRWRISSDTPLRNRSHSSSLCEGVMIVFRQLASKVSPSILLAV